VFMSGSSTVYVRIENSFTDTDQKCYVVVPLELVVNLWPVVGPMTPLVACMDFPTPTTEFNLRDKDAEAIAAEVLAGNDPDDFIVKYYSSQGNAEADRSPLPYIYTRSEEHTSE